MGNACANSDDGQQADVQFSKPGTETLTAGNYATAKRPPKKQFARATPDHGENCDEMNKLSKEAQKIKSSLQKYQVTDLKARINFPVEASGLHTSNPQGHQGQVQQPKPDLARKGSDPTSNPKPRDVPARFSKVPEGSIFIGPLVFEDKSTYNGHFAYGLRHGYGESVDSVGAYYDGYWDQDLKSFQGREIEDDGDYYEGEWKDGQRSGLGIFNSKTLGFICKGHFANGLPEGRCLIEYLDGSKFDGNLVKGKREGQGHLIFGDKSSFSGIFKDDQPHNGNFETNN